MCHIFYHSFAVNHLVLVGRDSMVPPSIDMTKPGRGRTKGDKVAKDVSASEALIPAASGMVQYI